MGKHRKSTTRKRQLRSKHKLGLPPGTLVFTGHARMQEPEGIVYHYRGDHFTEQVADLSTLKRIPPDEITWVNLKGVHDRSLIEGVGQQYDIHPLILEDIMDVFQRPKFEDYATGYYLTMRNFRFDLEERELIAEQISIFGGRDFVCSFQEDPDDLFSGVADRLKKEGSRFRERDSDYLAYALIDRVVDGYFHTLDDISTTIEDLEEEILSGSDRNMRERIHRMRRELFEMRKSIRPLSDAINALMRSDTGWISTGTEVFFRDVIDHILQVLEQIETCRDTLMGLQDMYVSEMASRTGNVMKLLTIIATIFIPLTFLVGVYGMNFDHMPELHWRYSYYIVWGLMLAVAITMLLYFRRKGWL